MNSALFVHMPAHLLEGRLSFLLNRKLQPEIACQEVSIDQLDFDQLQKCTAALAERQLGTTLHAPFIGFNPGSSRRKIRRESQEMARKAFHLANIIRAQKIVFHPALPIDSSFKQIDAWLGQSLTFWPEFIPLAEASNCCICIENIYESTPEPLLQLCQEMNSDFFGHCFDIGHWNIFGKVELETWLNQAAPWLKHLHLHDNYGKQDEHLPVGHGYASFTTLFNWLKANGRNLTYTLEAHNLPDLDSSLAALEHYLSK